MTAETWLIVTLSSIAVGYLFTLFYIRRFYHEEPNDEEPSNCLDPMLAAKPTERARLIKAEIDTDKKKR